MTTEIFDILACPLCGSALSCEDGKTVKCGENHSFDIAKSGYVNLLPPGKEKNPRTGDEKLMLKARGDFLSRGYYSPISEKAAEIAADHAHGTTETFVTLDLGSGKGHHTLNYTKELISRGLSPLTVGFDASKYGAEYGMKQSRASSLAPAHGVGEKIVPPACVFFPSNIFSLPVKDNCADCCISMFAPIPWDEVRRVLKDGGILIVVSSGEKHLYEMRRMIYDDVIISDSKQSFEEKAGSFGFAEIHAEKLMYTMHLSENSEIMSLFTMTPFYYKTTREGRERLLAADSADITVDVNYTVFRAGGRA